MYSFSYLEPVCYSMPSSNYCFLTCIQVSQEAGQVVWYSHLFQNFPQFIVIHTVKGFGILNKAEIDVSLELCCFFDDPVDVGNLISGSSAFSKTSLNILQRRQWHSTPVLFPGKSHGQTSLVGSHGVGKSWTRLSDFTFTFHFHVLEKEMATHSSVLAWRIPGMGEPGGLPSMGSHRVRHD